MIPAIPHPKSDGRASHEKHSQHLGRGTQATFDACARHLLVLRLEEAGRTRTLPLAPTPFHFLAHTNGCPDQLRRCPAARARRRADRPQGAHRPLRPARNAQHCQCKPALTRAAACAPNTGRVCARRAAQGCRVCSPGACRRCRRPGAVHRRSPAGPGQLLRQHADGCVGRDAAISLPKPTMLTRGAGRRLARSVREGRADCRPQEAHRRGRGREEGRRRAGCALSGRRSVAGGLQSGCNSSRPRNALSTQALTPISLAKLAWPRAMHFAGFSRDAVAVASRAANKARLLIRCYARAFAFYACALNACPLSHARVSHAKCNALKVERPAECRRALP